MDQHSNQVLVVSNTGDGAFCGLIQNKRRRRYSLEGRHTVMQMSNIQIQEMWTCIYSSLPCMISVSFVRTCIQHSKTDKQKKRKKEEADLSFFPFLYWLFSLDLILLFPTFLLLIRSVTCDGIFSSS